MASLIGERAAQALWRDYLELTKPKVVVLMLITSLVGMFLATRAGVPWTVLVFGNLGIALCAGGAAAVNHVVDRRIDAVMARTHKRPLAEGRVSPAAALTFALVLALLGQALLLTFTNQLTAWLTLASLLGYAVVYTGFLKRATPQNIVIGGLAGAGPTAARLDRRHRPCQRRTAVAGADHLRLDPAAFLGAGDSSQGGIRQGRHSDAAGHSRRALHQSAHSAVHLCVAGSEPLALRDSHERRAVSGQCAGVGRKVSAMGRGAVPWHSAARGDQHLQVLYLLLVPVVHRPARRPLLTVEPMTRTQKTVFILVAVIALILGLTVNKVLSGKGQGDPTALIDAGIILLPQSRNLPDVTMTDQDGKPVAIDELKGKWSLLFFGYTFCPDICPTTLAQLRQIKSELPKEAVDKLQIVLVSVDPNRDTPKQLKQYLGYFDPQFIGLTPTSIEELQKVANAVSIPFIPADTSKPNYTVDHSGNLAVIGPDGTQRGFIRAPLNNAKLVAQLPAMLERK
jgi:protein SCO1/2